MVLGRRAMDDIRVFMTGVPSYLWFSWSRGFVESVGDDHMEE